MNKVQFKHQIIKKRNSSQNISILNTIIWIVLLIEKFHEYKKIFPFAMLILMYVLLILCIIDKIKLKKLCDTTYVYIQNDRVLIRKDLLSKQKTIMLDDINYIDIGEKKIKIKTNKNKKYSINCDYVDTIDGAELKYLFKKLKEYILDKNQLIDVK